MFHELQRGECSGWRAGDYQRENGAARTKHLENRDRFAELRPTEIENPDELKAIIEEREQIAERMIEIHRLKRALEKESLELQGKMSALYSQGFTIVSLANYETTYQSIYGEPSKLKFAKTGGMVEQLSKLS